LVIGTPLYNFGMPAALKAWVDQVVRLGKTVDMDESIPHDPFIPKLADRPRHAVILAARGGIGLGPGGEMAHMNHLEPNLITALEFIGITRIHCIAIEGQEAGGELLAASVAEAQQKIEALIEALQVAFAATPRSVPDLALSI
jgi:FMN-dependent NADH-azoreductase